jgi:multidrug transporter EmrE-like cation transporter
VIDYTTTQLARLLSFALFMAAGQVLFKKVSLMIPSLDSWRAIISLGSNVWFLLAISLYMLATFLWIDILREIPLSRAYPFIAIGFVLVPLAGYFFFAEPLNARYFAGVALIVTGIYLTALAG